MSNYDQSLATAETATDNQIQHNQINLHTALPAKVISFNANNQTVTLAVQISQVLTDGTTDQLPPLLDVPVSFPRGGGYAVTFPLQAGDEGLAVFNERCIDGWWQSGGISPPLDFRLHDLSDAVFFPGICSIPKALQGFFTEGISLQTLDGNTYIRLTNGQILIKGNIDHQGDTTQKGNHQSSGTVTGKVDVVGGGKSLKGHKHQGDSGGQTGGPL